MSHQVIDIGISENDRLEIAAGLSRFQPPGQVAQGQCGGADGTAGHVAEPVAVHIHHAKTGSLQAGVNP